MVDMPVYSYDIQDVDGNIRYNDFVCAPNKKDAELYADMDADRKSKDPSCKFTVMMPVQVVEVVDDSSFAEALNKANGY